MNNNRFDFSFNLTNPPNSAFASNQQQQLGSESNFSFNIPHISQNDKHHQPFAPFPNEFGFDFSIRHDLESQHHQRPQTSTNNKDGFDFSINQNDMINDEKPIKLPPPKPPQIFNSSRNSNSSADVNFNSSMSSSMSSSMYSSSGSSSSNSRNMSGMNFNFSSNCNDEKSQNLKNQRVYIPPFKIKPGNNEYTFTSQSGSSFPGMKVNIIDNEENLEFPPGFSGAIYA